MVTREYWILQLVFELKTIERQANDLVMAIIIFPPLTLNTAPILLEILEISKHVKIYAGLCNS
jgi:hypothetical protein